MEASVQETAATFAGCLPLSSSGERKDISPKYANRTAFFASISNAKEVNLNVYFLLYELFSNKADKT